MGRDKVQVTLYTRRGCHLCEEARREMLAAGIPERFTLVETDVDSDPALAARYGYDIPVILVNGRLTFKHRLTAAQFVRAVNSES
ncbi:MAG TPA: glutaredoxin family protein [Pyrinomonadaceae bacterium]|nr:glutaredoxin family protein [Pyrinomonadaceae bacterium]